MKIKKGSIAIFSVLFLLSIVPLISAYSYGFFDLGQGSQDVVDAVTNFAAPLFSALIGDYYGGEFFFAKILLLILLFVIINAVLVKVDLFGKQNAGVSFIVSAVISILAVRFISDNDLSRFILLPYATVGIVITTILPLIVLFYFLHVTNMGSIGRRLSWIFFAIVFLSLWYSRRTEISDLGNQIYLWTAIVMGLVFIFDKKIHSYFAIHELSIFYKKASERHIAGLQAEYLNILNVDTPQANSRKDQIQRELQRLGANAP